MSDKQEVIIGFLDTEVRCEKMIPIYMCLADRPSQDLLDAIFEEETVCELLGLPLDIEAEHEIIELLQRNNKVGFLAEFATPKPIRFSKDGATWVSGWGYYQKKWFYSDDIESLEDAAVEWAQDHFEECKRKTMSEVSDAN